VLGKHIPTDPRLVRTTGLLLGSLVKEALATSPTSAPTLHHATTEILYSALRGDSAALTALYTDATRALHTASSSSASYAEPPGDPTGPESPDVLVLGFAETATALGHCVADALDAHTYLHSTRRRDTDQADVVEFREEHSPASQHLLLPTDPRLLHGGQPLVLVDDEISTGQTAINTITTLHHIAPRNRYIVATLLDTRTEPRALTDAVTALGAHVQVVALSTARVDLPGDLLVRVERLRARLVRADPGPGKPGPTHAPAARRIHLARLGWPPELPVGARHGWTRKDRAHAEKLLPPVVEQLARHLPQQQVLVLGTEELMALPLRIAEQLHLTTGADVVFSTTTRSPALVVSHSGYAITSSLQFAAHDTPLDGPGPRFAYNLGGPTDPPWEAILLVVDHASDTPALIENGGLLSALATRTRHLVILVAP
jgi:hypothetical protein